MSELPNKLTATNCAAASDGGSVVLVTADPEQREYSFHLDWSLAAQTSKTMQLYVNSAAIPKGSVLEATWLRLLAEADIRYSDPDAPDKDYSEAVRSLRDGLIEQLTSEAYQKGRGQ